MKPLLLKTKICFSKQGLIFLVVQNLFYCINVFHEIQVCCECSENTVSSLERKFCKNLYFFKLKGISFIQIYKNLCWRSIVNIDLVEGGLLIRKRLISELLQNNLSRPYVYPKYMAGVGVNLVKIGSLGHTLELAPDIQTCSHILKKYFLSCGYPETDISTEIQNRFSIQSLLFLCAMVYMRI